jgi:hypothetical protein
VVMAVVFLEQAGSEILPKGLAVLLVRFIME